MDQEKENQKPVLVSDKELQRIAKELGIEVEINSKNPGTHNTTTGEIITWNEVASKIEDIFPLGENKSTED